jgi:hypothetical protein
MVELHDYQKDLIGSTIFWRVPYFDIHPKIRQSTF